jgi:hypothetical protein
MDKCKNNLFLSKAACNTNSRTVLHATVFCFCQGQRTRTTAKGSSKKSEKIVGDNSGRFWTLSKSRQSDETLVVETENGHCQILKLKAMAFVLKQKHPATVKLEVVEKEVYFEKPKYTEAGIRLAIALRNSKWLRDQKLKMVLEAGRRYAISNGIQYVCREDTRFCFGYK